MKNEAGIDVAEQITKGQVGITPYHAKYYAHELTKHCASGSMEKLDGALVDAQVDLNPHQAEAALFAFKSPLSSGAILPDEVELGKTIEADFSFFLWLWFYVKPKPYYCVRAPH